MQLLSTKHRQISQKKTHRWLYFPCFLTVTSYCSFTDIPHQCGQTRCWHRGVNRANQPENEMEKLSQKATLPIIWYFRSTAASALARVGSTQPARPTSLCTLRKLEPMHRIVSPTNMCFGSNRPAWYSFICFSSILFPLPFRLYTLLAFSKEIKTKLHTESVQ